MLRVDGEARVRRVDGLLPLPEAEVGAREHLVAVRLERGQADRFPRATTASLYARLASMTRDRA